MTEVIITIKNNRGKIVKVMYPCTAYTVNKKGMFINLFNGIGRNVIRRTILFDDTLKIEIQDAKNNHFVIYEKEK